MTLFEQFKNMSAQPLFEIEHEVYHIIADDTGLHAGDCTNIGFRPYDGLFVGWDDVFSFDEHLQALHELCLEA